MLFSHFSKVNSLIFKVSLNVSQFESNMGVLIGISPYHSVKQEAEFQDIFINKSGVKEKL